MQDTEQALLGPSKSATSSSNEVKSVLQLFLFGDMRKWAHNGLIYRKMAYQQVVETDPGEGNGTPLQYSCWKIPWMEEPGRLQSTGLLKVGHD